MMTTADDYIDRVLSFLPRATPMRSQIALELRGHIAERVAHGQPLDAVLGQLGEPDRLAESYLREVPLVAAPLGRRLAAKLADVALAIVFAVPPALLAWLSPREELRVFAIIAAMVACIGGFFVYTIAAEYWLGQTLGKYLAGLQVVRESGAPIGLGQAIVRQLPVPLQIFWIDMLFALFTDRRQRAFELLSQTRVVVVAGGAVPGV